MRCFGNTPTVWWQEVEKNKTAVKQRRGANFASKRRKEIWKSCEKLKSIVNLIIVNNVMPAVFKKF